MMENDYSHILDEDAGKEFITACINNQLDNVKKILSEKRLEANISEDQFCMGFNWAAGENYDAIIDYLIMDYQIPKFKAIEVHVDVLDNEKLKKMFENRVLIKELNNELNISSEKKIQLKI